MQKISDHFYRHEFACKCGCGRDTVDVELIALLESIRRNFGGHPIVVMSGNRCWAHNAKIGGSKKSKHPLGKAGDIVIAGIPPEEIGAYVDETHPDEYGVGIYSSWTHVDIRERKARWRERSNSGWKRFISFLMV